MRLRTSPPKPRLAALLFMGLTLIGAACGASIEVAASGDDGPVSSVPTATPAAPTTAPENPVEPEPDGEPATPEPGTAPDINQADLEALEEAEARWADARIDDYSYYVVVRCECDAEFSGPRLVTVIDGQVAEVIYDGRDSQAPGWTAEDLFAEIRAGVTRGVEVIADYDDNGFPVAAVVDVEATYVDGGFDYTTSDFTVEDGAPTSASPEQRALDAAKARWEAAAVSNYEMTYTQICFCPQVTLTIRVENGELLETDVVVDEGNYAPEVGNTVEDMFFQIEAAIERGAVLVEASYDPDTGAPLSWFVDLDEDIADEEYGVSVLLLIADGRIIVGPTDDERDPQTPPVDLPTPVEPSIPVIEPLPNEPPPDDPFCSAFLELVSSDDDPETPEEAEAMLAMFIDVSERMRENAPPELALGAQLFLQWMLDVRDAAEAVDYDPAFFENGGAVEEVATDDVFDQLDDHFVAVDERCSG